MHFIAVELGVGAGEVDELEDAELRVDALLGEGPLGTHFLPVDHDHLARFELADEGRTEHIETRRLRSEHPPRLELVGRLQPAEAEGTESVRVADPDQAVRVEEHEGERALERREDGGECVLEVAFAGKRLVGAVGREGVGEQLGDQIAVGRDQAGKHPRRLAERGRVGEVAVVGEPESGTPDAAENGLGMVPVARARRRVPGVADREMAAQPRELAFVEHGGDEAHVLHDGDQVAVADRHARRLLAPVLEGVEPVEGEVCDIAPRGIDPEDAARFLRLHHRFVTVLTGARRFVPRAGFRIPVRSGHSTLAFSAPAWRKQGPERAVTRAGGRIGKKKSRVGGVEAQPH